MHCHARRLQVPGQNYQICNEPSPYLTSPWTYHALESGSRSYSVSQYKTLPGYGKTLASLAFLHRKRELRDEGRRDLRTRQLRQPASV